MQFSVAMCVYRGDNPDYFRTALESVFQQERIPDEVILTVDGPVPKETDEIISECAKEHLQLKVSRLPQNMGHGIARRESIKNCSCPYIAIADADDINYPTRFRTQIKCFEDDPELDIVGSSHEKFIGDRDNVISVSKRPQHHDDIVKLMKTRCPITQACVMFSRKIYDAAGGYLDWYCAEDYYLWIRMFEAGGKFYNCPEILVSVRTSDDQYKRRGGWKYYKSTAAISKYMLDKGIIKWGTHIKNIVPRFIIQVLCPNKLRGAIRNRFIRSQSKNNCL